MREIKQKKPLEFFQKWLIGCAAVTVFFILQSYILAYIGAFLGVSVDTVSEIGIAIINTLWVVDGASVIGYAGLNGFRAYCADKYGFEKLTEFPTGCTSSDDEYDESEESSNEDEEVLG